MSAPPAVIVVPCFNEERRIDERAFAALAASGALRLLFVDDGSVDDTARVLARMAEGSAGIEVFTLDRNAGKAEAVRRGILVALRGGARVVGYYDADLATPPAELLRMVDLLHSRSDLAGVLGSRVARLGSAIERNALRHYLGRAYATLASIVLGITVYDTQCGAKVFRVTDAFTAAVAEPFRSSWAFDVELLHRLLTGSGRAPGVPVTAFTEVPLDAWHDVSGSKMRLGPALAALFDLVPLARRRARPGSGAPGPQTGPRPVAMAPPVPADVPGPGDSRPDNGDPGKKQA